MISIVADWSGMEKCVAAIERMNPSARMTVEQVQRWWEFISRFDGRARDR